MKKKDENLKTILLDLAKTIVNEEGIDSLNIRNIAKKANIATGTVYNYFSSKDELLLALTDEYWTQILIDLPNHVKSILFYEQVKEIYLFLSEQIKTSTGPLMHSLQNSNVGEKGYMSSRQHVLKETFIQYMNNDLLIDHHIWNETFTQEEYASFILMNMIILLQTETSNIDFFVEVIKRNLY